MERQELSALLKKQLNGTIKHQEFAQLKQLVFSLDEHLVEQCLYEVWEAYEATGKRNKSSFEIVKANLKRIIQPQNKLEEQTLEPEKVTIPFIYYAQRIAAFILLPLMLSFGVYYFTKKSTLADLAKNQYSIETSSGERTRLVLPDGTRVMVSANSTFTYPATFGKENREVSLSGEAYFDVTHNVDLPFIVKSRDMNIKVLGTKFNVYAYPAEAYFEASLVEGKIQAYSSRNKNIAMTLLPNEKVRYNYASETLEKTSTDLQVETAWTRGDLYFQSETLLSILPKLERYYGVKFDINGQLPTNMLTASYHETDVNEILRNLAIHYRFSYTKNGELIHLNIK
jgi:ferric-dicitrate binding protein FerR (iron transport regulator)